MATAKKNPEGCGSVKISGCSERVCRCLQLLASTGAACPSPGNQITKTIELKVSDPANELFEWSTSFSVDCPVPPLPPTCTSRQHDFLLRCDHGDWQAYLNNVQMTKNSAQCSPVSMAFEIGNPKDCVATGLAVTITDVPE